MIGIIKNSLHQDKGLKNLLKTKYYYRKYINYCLMLGIIAFDELYLNCNTNKTFSKIFRVNKDSYDKNSNRVVVGLNHYILTIPKKHNRKFLWYKPKSELKVYKTLYLKVLNQKLTFKIYDDTFYYYIETFLELPNLTEKERDWFKKQFDIYIFKLLREGKLTNSNTTDKISQNIEKNIKNNPIRTHFKKGYESFLVLLSQEQKDLWVLGKIRLKFKDFEFPLFHNARLMVNGKLIILDRSINELLVNDFKDIGEVFTTFIEVGLLLKGFDVETLSPPEVVSFELAEPLSQFDYSEHRDLRVLRYSKNNRRDLGFIGYENYYDYIDNSDGLEYEIQYFNRKQKTIPEIIRELEYLLDYNKFPLRNIIEIESFDISPSIENTAYCFTNDFSNFENNIYESKDYGSFRLLASKMEYQLIANKS